MSRSFRPQENIELMTLFPPHIQAMFVPRPPLEYLPPLQRDPGLKPLPAYQGVGAFMKHFEAAKHREPVAPILSVQERKRERKRQKQLVSKEKLNEAVSKYDPFVRKENVTEDPFKTIFVGHISQNVNEYMLKKEFTSFGPVKSLYLVRKKIFEKSLETAEPEKATSAGVSSSTVADKLKKKKKKRKLKKKPLSKKPASDPAKDHHSGYAFVEFEHEKDMRSAYKYADGKKLEGNRLVVDVERSRTVRGWLPRRLGGGYVSSRPASTEPSRTSDSRSSDRASGSDRYASSYRSRESREGRGSVGERSHRGGESRGGWERNREERDYRGRDTSSRDYRSHDKYREEGGHRDRSSSYQDSHRRSSRDDSRSGYSMHRNRYSRD